MRKKRNRGFTLIEIMVVVVIIGLLAGVAGVAVMDRLAQAKVTQTLTQMKELSKALDLYRLDYSTYPRTNEGLKKLLPKGNKRKKKYLKEAELPKDAWGNDFVYRKNRRGGGFLIISYGADAREGGEGYDKDLDSDHLSQN